VDEALQKIAALATQLDASSMTMAAEKIDCLLEKYATMPVAGFMLGGQHIQSEKQLTELLSKSPSLIQQLITMLRSSPKLQGDKAFRAVFIQSTPGTISASELAKFLADKGLLVKGQAVDHKSVVQRGVDWAKQQWQSTQQLDAQVPTLAEILGVADAIPSPSFIGGTGALSQK